MHDDAISQLRIMLNLGKRQIDRYYVTRLLEAYDHAVEQRGKAADYLLKSGEEWQILLDRAIRQRDYANGMAQYWKETWATNVHLAIPMLEPEDRWPDMP